jgi:hypothetical protein
VVVDMEGHPGKAQSSIKVLAQGAGWNDASFQGSV